MKNMKRYLLGICACGLLTMTSCYDLEQLPQDAVVIDFNEPQKAYPSPVLGCSNSSL